MNRRALGLSLAIGGAAGFGCASKSLPPGTPPPEYEQRTLEPWPPNGASDAGVVEADSAPPVPSDPVPSEPAAPPGEADAGTGIRPNF